MKITRHALLLLAGLSTAACTAETLSDDGAGDPARGHGKADGPLEGSCLDGDVDVCGGPAAEGNCWCDEKCHDFGDCCDDKEEVCGGLEPRLCMSDDQCGDGQVCDHTECLSNCPDDPNIACPAVCWGQCAEEPAPVDCTSLDEDECGEEELCEWDTVPGFPGPISMCRDVDTCDINPLTVFCTPGTFFSVEACACVPFDPPPADCNTLDETECETHPDCDWQTVPGFPGPISMCVGGGECDIDPTTVLCGPDTLFSLEACGCVPIDPVDPPGCDVPPGFTVVSGAEFSADPDAFVGQQIAVTGTSMPTGPICTQLACGPDFPCCNSCGAGIDMVFEGGGDLEMSGLGCGGNSCDVLSNCDVPAFDTFTAWGTVDEGFGIVHLDVEGHC